MAGTTVTIEIRKETAILLLQIAAGLLLIGGTFLLTYEPMNYWKAVSMTGAVAGLFVGALAGAAVAPPVRWSHRIIVLGVVGVLAGFLSFGWRTIQETTSWQRGLLLHIRGVIGRGVLLTGSPVNLGPVLDRYYALPEQQRTSVGKVFSVVYPDHGQGSKIRSLNGENDTSTVWIVTEFSDSAVTIVGVDAVGRGWDPDFVSIDGRRGAIQLRSRLTARGIDYATDN
ncbi:MAG: hypothetical protein AABY75_03230 [Bacteroidota bacterium]